MIEERGFVRDIFSSVFKGSPKTPVWEWADKNVFLDEKQSAEFPRYDSSQTPWTREIQDAVRDPDTNEVAAMKCSQSGLSESLFNVIRYMPTHIPRNVLYVINSRDKASDVAKSRIAPQLRIHAKDQISDDPHDFSTLTIRLKNMIIKLSGSGTTSPVRETWYGVVIEDEPEDYEALADGTIHDLVKSRFATVSEYTHYTIGKPQQEGGIIHDCFLRGSQERWMVPCPRCEKRIELKWDQIRFTHCQDLQGEWDLFDVLTDTWYQCQKCDGRIDEHEKAAMVLAGEWVPRPKNERMLLKSKPISPEPGVRSFHISDLYSPFPQVTWGKLAKKWISCAFMNLNEAKKDDFTKNHLGMPVAPKELHVTDQTILALRGGLEETVYYDAINEAGEIEKRSRTEKHGSRFGLCYDQAGNRINDLPCDPIFLTISVDKQSDCLKYTVIAWQRDGQAWLVDFGRLANENELLTTMRTRKYRYRDEGAGIDVEHGIYGGCMDRGYKSQEVYRCCRRAQALGWRLYPVLGWGAQNERYMSESLSEKEETLKGGVKIKYYKFHDHSIKVDFYFGCIQDRNEPRLWLPDPVPADIVTELTSEYWEAAKGRFVHPEGAPPNDYADTLKMQKGVNWPILSGVLAK